MQRAYQPVLIGADLDRTVFGRRGNQTGESPGVHVSPWVVNDQHRKIDDATYEVRLQGAGGKVVVGSGKAAAPLAEDFVTTLPELDCVSPQDLPPGDYELVLTLKEGRQTVSENSYEVVMTE